MLQNNNRPILHLICGLPGSGKTTLAKSIAAATRAIRFSPDEWMRAIWDDKAEFEGTQLRSQVEQLQWKVAKQLLQIAVDVIIEWGTWGRNERETLRDEAKALGAAVHFYYLNVPREVLKERILQRNRAIGQHDFYIADDGIEAFLGDCYNCFQVPTPEELAGYDFAG